MKKFDLDAEIKAMRVPERGEEFWDDLPRRVTSELRQPPPATSRRPAARPRYGWATGLALASLMLAFGLLRAHAPRQVLFAVIQDEREFRQTIRTLPDHLQVFMEDEHGLHYLVADPQ